MHNTTFIAPIPFVFYPTYTVNPPTMTRTEFFGHYKKALESGGFTNDVRETPYLRFVTVGDMRGQILCPITLVCLYLTKAFFGPGSYRRAAAFIGLSDANATGIAAAADGEHVFSTIEEQGALRNITQLALVVAGKWNVQPEVKPEFYPSLSLPKPYNSFHLELISV